METSALLLIASLGAIVVMLMLHVYIYAFERKSLLMLWFAGWFIIALNYLLEVFHPYFLRQNQTIILVSLCSYFLANLLISWGTLLFLKTNFKTFHFIGIEIIWLILFIVFTLLNVSALHMIQYTYLTVFALFTLVGIVMLRLVRKHGKLILVLGLLNIAWVANNLVFSYILKMPDMAPYYVSQIILILNAIGLIQLYFKEQKDTIREGMDYISYLTFHDGLTGLYNKTYFDSKLQEMENDKKCLPVSVIVGDMNGLKFVNDVFGHHEGDDRLKKIADIIRECCRPDDIIARWGGDEFAVILPNTYKETACSILDKISEASNSFRGRDILTNLSLGMATKTSGDASLHMLLKEAEDIMYHAKLIEGRKIRGAIAKIIAKELQENDYEMKGHIERLQGLAKDFGKVIGLSAAGMDTLIRAVTLHDIGKIGISKDIIQKKSPLDDSEWLMMKKHVEIGYRIAQASGEFAHLSDIILYHHEWWNGQGYPEGLKGEDIPLMSRIISILDAFDVMTHRQQGDPSMTAEEALQELRLKAGIQFDPSLAHLFIQMMNKQ